MDLINALMGAKLIKSPPVGLSTSNTTTLPTTQSPRPFPTTFMSEQSLETLNTENFVTAATTPNTFGNESHTTAPGSSDNASFASSTANLPQSSLSTNVLQESSLASETPIEPEIPANLLANSPSNLHDPLNIDEHHLLGTHLPGQEVNNNHAQIQDSGTDLNTTTITTSTGNPETNKGFAIFTGGKNEQEEPISSIELFHGTEQFPACVSSIDLPLALFDHMLAKVDESIVVCGGFTGQIITPKCNKLEKSTNAWSPIPDLPFGLRDGNAVAVGSKLYLIGGWSEFPLKSVLMIDLAVKSQQWTSQHDLKAARFSPCSVQWQGQIYVTGGAENNGQTDLESIEVVNSNVSLPSMNFARRHHACIILTLQNPGILVAGGIGNGLEHIPKSVEFFDLTLKQSWQKLSDLPKPRCCWPQMVLIQNSVFIVSGEQMASESIGRFDFVNQTWIEETSLKLAVKRSQSRALFFNDAESSVFPDNCSQ